MIGADGCRRRRKRTARTYAQARAALAELTREADAARAGIVGAGRLTVDEWLADWLANVVPGRVHSPNTIANYAWAAGHVSGRLGNTGLGSLTPEDVDRLLAAKAAAGMSRNSVARIRAVLNDALRHAERRVLVTRNVATLAV
ncbi:MAG: site-specific integrase, partial [Acidimicrobiales bacterium]